MGLLKMALNESISELISEGFRELSASQISFGLKIMVIFGFLFFLNTAVKTGASLVEIIIYVIGFFKWVIYKILKKDI